jgi:uncharacterized OsmC-like protein
MNYQIKASSISNKDGIVLIKDSKIDFGTGTGSGTSETLANPAELFLGSIAACILKNVERYSVIMKFIYSKANLEIKATRNESPPSMDNIVYDLTIHTDDKKLNTRLLKKNIEKFGTIYNTVKQSCAISGTINTKENV